jgi:hypothetical protein
VVGVNPFVVQAYAHFLLVDSVAPQYGAFQTGFQQVLAHI